MLTKSQVTQTIIEQLGQEPRPSLEQGLLQFWHNRREDGSWRLTNAGYEAFIELGIEHHQFDVPNHMPVIPRHLLILDHKLTQPYFIRIGKHPGLILFGSREATMYALYGDFEKFLRYLDRS
jgi:hypothetical protein